MSNAGGACALRRFHSKNKVILIAPMFCLYCISIYERFIYFTQCHMRGNRGLNREIKILMIRVRSYKIIIHPVLRKKKQLQVD